MEKEIHPWILGRPKTILTKTGSQNTLTTMYMDTWQNIVESQKRNEIQRSVINATR